MNNPIQPGAALPFQLPDPIKDPSLALTIAYGFPTDGGPLAGAQSQIGFEEFLNAELTALQNFELSLETKKVAIESATLPTNSVASAEASDLLAVLHEAGQTEKWLHGKLASPPGIARELDSQIDAAQPKFQFEASQTKLAEDELEQLNLEQTDAVLNAQAAVLLIEAETSLDPVEQSLNAATEIEEPIPDVGNAEVSQKQKGLDTIVDSPVVSLDDSGQPLVSTAATVESNGLKKLNINGLNNLPAGNSEAIQDVPFELADKSDGKSALDLSSSPTQYVDLTGTVRGSQGAQDIVSIAGKSRVEANVVDIVADNLIQQVELSEVGDSKQLKLQLHPAELGQVTLQVDWENEQLRVKLLANEIAASEILNQNRSELVTALAEEGIDFDSLEISYESQSSEFSQQEDDPDGNEQALPPELFMGPIPAGATPSVPTSRKESSLDIKI